MRLMLVGSNPLAPTGYGTVVKGLSKIFSSLGHEVLVSAPNTWSGSLFTTKDFTILPVGITLSGQPMEASKIVITHLQRYKPDCVITIGDAFVYKWLSLFNLKIPWIGYFPIDGMCSLELAGTIKHMDYKVTFSKFGLRMLKKRFKNCLYCIPHVIDEAFKPLDRTRLNKVKARLGLKEDSIIYLYVGSNCPRKRIATLLECFKKLLEKNYSRSLLLLATNRFDPSGFRLTQIIRDLNLLKNCKFLPYLET